MTSKAKENRPVFIGIGEVLWDILPGGRALGGAPMNVACHAAQLGAASTAVSAATLRALLAMYGLRLVVLTKGAHGSRMMTSDADINHPGCKTNIVDTVGAGDAFTAATTMGLLRGLPLERIQDAANRVAAYVCSQPGAVPRGAIGIRHARWIQ